MRLEPRLAAVMHPKGCRMCCAVLGTLALVGSASAGFELWSEVCPAAGFSPAGLMEDTQCRLRAEVQMLWGYALRDAEAACPSLVFFDLLPIKSLCAE